MSGSGGGRSDTGGGFGGSVDDDTLCDIVKVVPLNSPNPAVISTLKVGDILSVSLETANGGQIVIVRNAEGNNAGSLTYTGFTTLIKCIQKGFSYKAVVEKLEGGSCLVRIQPAD